MSADTSQAEPEAARHSDTAHRVLAEERAKRAEDLGAVPCGLHRALMSAGTPA